MVKPYSNVPSHLLLDAGAFDAFMEHGRFVLFVDMISQTAKDLLWQPPETAHSHDEMLQRLDDHQNKHDAISWVRGASAKISFATLCDLVGASDWATEKLRERLLNEPEKLVHALEVMSRHTQETNFESFAQTMMGVFEGSDFEDRSGIDHGNSKLGRYVSQVIAEEDDAAPSPAVG
jgi:hypothetical protein